MMSETKNGDNVWIEPGPAAFYLPAEESASGVEEEIFKFNFSSMVPTNTRIFTSFEGISNVDLEDEPLDIQLSLDDLKAEGIDLQQLIQVRY